MLALSQVVALSVGVFAADQGDVQRSGALFWSTASMNFDPAVSRILDDTSLNAQQKKDKIKSLGTSVSVQQRMAASAAADLVEQRQKLKAAADEAQKSMNTIQGQIDTQNEVIGKAEAQYKASSAEAKEWDPGLFAGGKAKQQYQKFKDVADKDEKALDGAKGSLKDIKKNYSKAESDYDAKVKEISKNDEAINSAAVKEVEKLNELEERIGNAQVTAKLADIKSQISDIEVRREVLERRYDQGMIGDYMKAKMAGLLVSDQMCASIKNCEGNKNKSNQKPNLDGLFFNEKGTRGVVDEGSQGQSQSQGNSAH